MNDAETDPEHSVPAQQQTDPVAEPPESIEATPARESLADGNQADPVAEPAESIEATPERESLADGNQADPVPDAKLAETTPDEHKPTISNAATTARTRDSLTSTDLNLVGSVQVKLTLNVGSKSMTIADVLNLERGSVVTLNRREHDPLDVLINGVVFARGEVVRTGDYYGLRILEIL